MGDTLERIIDQLLSVKNARPGTEVTLAEEDIVWLCRKCREVSPEHSGANSIQHASLPSAVTVPTNQCSITTNLSCCGALSPGLLVAAHALGSCQPCKYMW